MTDGWSPQPGYRGYGEAQVYFAEGGVPKPKLMAQIHRTPEGVTGKVSVGGASMTISANSLEELQTVVEAVKRHGISQMTKFRQPSCSTLPRVKAPPEKLLLDKGQATAGGGPTGLS